MPGIPRDQQSPYPGGQRTAVAKTGGPDNQVDTSANAIRGPPRLWDRDTTCAFFGGIDISTLYRGMAAKRYPRPVFVSANVARWLADECEAALERMIAERDKPKPPSRRGRKGRRIERAETEAAAAVKLLESLEAASKAKADAS
jgi:predicted DNA-binding transcriptional regulator AlpA